MKKEKPPFQAESPTADVVKPVIPSELLCALCKDLLSDAVLIPCCGDSFCDDCIRAHLLESEEHECPQCHNKFVSPDTLIPNRFLRTAVTNFRNETGYTKAAAAPSSSSSSSVALADVPLVDQMIEESLAAEEEAQLAETVVEQPKLEAPEELEEEGEQQQQQQQKAEGSADGSPQSTADGYDDRAEDSKEPPPPGGEIGDQIRMVTPTADEQPAAVAASAVEDDLAAGVDNSSTSTTTTLKAAAESPKLNAPSQSHHLGPISVSSNSSSSLSVLAQKAPLFALQQALLQGSPLLLGRKMHIEFISKHLFFNFFFFFWKHRNAEHTATGPHPAGTDGHAASADDVISSSVAADAEFGANGIRCDTFWP